VQDTSAKILAWLGGEASPPSAEPHPCRKPFTSTHLDPPRPTSTAPSRHFTALWGTLGRPMALKGATRSYHGTHMRRKVLNMSQSTHPNGSFEVSNLRKHRKTHTNITTSVLASCCLLDSSSLSFWSPGTQKGFPKRQKDHQGAQRPS